MHNVRRLRLMTLAFAIIIPILAGSGVFLWYIGGKTLSQPMSQTATINRLVASDTPPIYLPAPSYKLGDISVSGNDDQAALRDYSRAVASIMSVYDDKAIESELALIIKAAETGNQTTIEKISLATTRHSESALKLKAMTVPANIARVHLNLVNSLIGLAEATFLMSKIKEEPVVALESAQLTYPARLKNLFTAVNNLNFFLLASGVVLPEKERPVISLGL